MAKKKKLKKSVKRNFIIFILILIISSFGLKLYKDYQYKQTFEYKLLEIDYSLDETKDLIKHLNEKELNDILNIKKDSNIIKFISEKYFIYNNLERYLKYLEKNENKEINNIISLVNVNRDRDYYDNPIPTDISKLEKMIVNKYYYLEEDYEPDNVVKISPSHAYEGNSINEEVYSAFKNLAEEAKSDGYTILINSSYRDYNSQKEVWESRKDLYGTRKADAFAARPGHSEHQTGYSIDVADFYDVDDTFGNTESFKWMSQNCYKYGFILRYPENKEDITGYSYEPWHYRYVGKELAMKIQKEDITFDEYYAFYLNK